LDSFSKSSYSKRKRKKNLLEIKFQRKTNNYRNNIKYISPVLTNSKITNRNTSLEHKSITKNAPNSIHPSLLHLHLHHHTSPPPLKTLPVSLCKIPAFSL
jgi:hypothetical protein